VCPPSSRAFIQCHGAPFPSCCSGGAGPTWSRQNRMQSVGFWTWASDRALALPFDNLMYSIRANSESDRFVADGRASRLVQI
jgi:hypothetical protein